MLAGKVDVQFRVKGDKRQSRRSLSRSVVLVVALTPVATRIAR